MASGKSKGQMSSLTTKKQHHKRTVFVSGDSKGAIWPQTDLNPFIKASLRGNGMDFVFIISEINLIASPAI